jgi:hypothetical protein
MVQRSAKSVGHEKIRVEDLSFSFSGTLSPPLTFARRKPEAKSPFPTHWFFSDPHNEAPPFVNEEKIS